MAAVIMTLDVGEIDGLPDPAPLVEAAGIVPEGRVVDQAPDVALEVAVIDRVEADQGREEAPVGLGRRAAA